MSPDSTLEGKGAKLMRTDDVDVGVRDVGEKTLLALYSTLDYGLAGYIEGQGLVMLGFSFKTSAGDCLMVVRADKGGSKVVCFIGSDSVPNCVLKAARDARDDLLRWKKDKYE